MWVDVGVEGRLLRGGASRAPLGAVAFLSLLISVARMASSSPSEFVFSSSSIDGLSVSSTPSDWAKAVPRRADDGMTSLVDFELFTAFSLAAGPASLGFESEMRDVAYTPGDRRRGSTSGTRQSWQRENGLDDPSRRREGSGRGLHNQSIEPDPFRCRRPTPRIASQPHLQRMLTEQPSRANGNRTADADTTAPPHPQRKAIVPRTR